MTEHTSIWGRLTAENPVALDEARTLVHDDLAHEIIRRGAIAPQVEERTEHSLRRRNRSTTRLPMRRTDARVLVLVAALVVGGALAAAPAFGWRTFRALSFFEREAAPPQRQVDFAAMSSGAPAGMDPAVIPDQTRKIQDAPFGGAVHTLWVAPTKLGGFCYLWTPGIGGCNSRGVERLDAVGELSLPPGVAGPHISENATKEQILSAMRAGHDLAIVPRWIVGYVKDSGGASAVAIRFRDGTTVHPQVTWVSQPIDAGFFAYDVPPDKRTASNHAFSVESVSSEGNVIERQLLTRNG